MERQAAPPRFAGLFAAMNEALAALSGSGSEEAALRASFEAAARGFGAEKALLLVVEEAEPLRLGSLLALGPLSPAQVAACERGESVKGVSPSVIRRVIASGEPELIEDPRLTAPAARTASLEDGDFSVLCAPVRAPLTGSVLAVLYFQNGGLEAAYGTVDLEWLKGYSAALGSVFGWHLERERRERELRELLESRERPEDAPELVGESRTTRELRRLLHETYIPALDAPSPDPILVVGERGVGKDLVARYLHAYSARGSRPLVAVSCAEITDELAASRLFGHKKGSFTGSHDGRAGAVPLRAAGRPVPRRDRRPVATRPGLPAARAGEPHRVSGRGGQGVPGGRRRGPRDEPGPRGGGAQRTRAHGLLRPFQDPGRPRGAGSRAACGRPAPPGALRSHHERRNRKRTLGFTKGAYLALLAHGWRGTFVTSRAPARSS